MALETLTEYERERVDQIAGWKAEPPSYLSAILDKLTRPLVVTTERLIPPEKIAEAIDNAYATSAVQIHRERIAEKAGVEDVRLLQQADLEICDQLADECAFRAAKGAMFWGAGAGGGPNLISTLVSLNALITYCLKTIHSIGYCYGFDTEEPYERDYVLGVLLIASTSTLKQKQAAIVTLGKVEDMIFEEAFEDLLKDAIGKQIVESAGLSTIPVVGMLTGAMHAAALTEHTAAVAKFCFAERWLRQRGRLERIEPDPKRARSVVGRTRARVANNVYWGAFGISFLVAVPVAWMFSWVPTDNVVFHGLQEGRDDACRDVDRLVGKIKGNAPHVSRAQMLIDVAGA